jgi:hypothetical protein
VEVSYDVILVNGNNVFAASPCLSSVSLVGFYIPMKLLTPIKLLVALVALVAVITAAAAAVVVVVVVVVLVAVAAVIVVVVIAVVVVVVAVALAVVAAEVVPKWFGGRLIGEEHQHSNLQPMP